MYKVLLVLRYLRKRRIAWVSLIAVTLCTALMLVVISVMGGWLRMFRLSCHGLNGDIQVKGTSMAGFPYYQEMVDGIEKLPEVGPGNAVPVIRTFGLVQLNNQLTEGVQVLGYPIDRIENVNEFGKSLYRQYQSRQDARAILADLKAKLTPEDKAYYERLARDKTPPSFDLVKDISAPLERLPAGIQFPEALRDKIWYVPREKLLFWRGLMTLEELASLEKLSDEPEYRYAIEALYHLSDFRKQLPGKLPKTVDPSTWPGIILGAGVAKIRKNEKGDFEGRHAWLYRMPVTLTVIGIPPEGRLDFKSDPPEPSPYWVVDDSRTKVYQVDANTVYVPFDRLQKDLHMTARESADGSETFPARASEIDIKIKPGANLDDTRNKIEGICDEVVQKHISARYREMRVETWEEANRLFLHAIENEKVLVMFLFGLISVVAVFLIFCIFYMIVVEKTRDIGIIKAVGATNSGVAGIFLGYGLVIGLVGAGLGWILAWLIVHNINEIHAWLGKVFHIVIWDPQVYAFDTIPNTMEPKEATVIVIVAIISAVLGALIPAVRAANLHPVEALRWE